MENREYFEQIGHPTHKRTYQLDGVDFIAEEAFHFTAIPVESNKNPDLRLWEEVTLHLTFNPDVDASEIQVVCTEGNVSLEGFVPRRLMKKKVQKCIEHIDGIKKITNHLEVRPSTWFYDFDDFGIL
jgi:hypothetical protein